MFPYPNDEQEFVNHPFYQSIEKVNIGAIPLQPGRNRENVLYRSYLDSLFERSGEAIYEDRIRYDSREYEAKRSAERDLILVGWIPSEYREERLAYHFNKLLYYTRWHKDSNPPLNQVKGIALYDSTEGMICAYGNVKYINVMQGTDLPDTGTSWPQTEPEAQHWVYSLASLETANLPCQSLMEEEREKGIGGFFVSRLGLELALEHGEPDLMFMPSWEKYREWKQLSTQYNKVRVHRTRLQKQSYGLFDLSFTYEDDR